METGWDNSRQPLIRCTLGTECADVGMNQRPTPTEGIALDRLAGDDFAAEDLFATVVIRSVEALGATAGGVLLSDAGRLRVAAASSERARLLELLQIQYDEGPCLDCFRSGLPVRGERMDTEESRWPRFAPVASEQGVAGALALPMHLFGRVIGVLEVVTARDASPMPADTIPQAWAVADLATLAIVRDRVARGRLALSEQLQGALDSRVVIEQAKGALATRLDIDHHDAFALIRAHARGTRRMLLKVAEEIISTAPSGDWERFRKET